MNPMPPASRQVGEVQSPGNFVWLQYGKKLAGKIPVFPTNDKTAWQLLTELAHSVDFEIGFTPGQDEIAAYDPDDSEGLKPKGYLFFRKRSALVTNLVLDESSYLGLQSELDTTHIFNHVSVRLSNGQVWVSKDETSIEESGILAYSLETGLFPNESVAWAETIGNKVLARQKDPRLKIEVPLKFSPHLVLGQKVNVRSEYHAFGNEGKEYKLTEVRHDLRRWQTRIQARQVLASGDPLELPEIEPFYFRVGDTVSETLDPATGGSGNYQYRLSMASVDVGDNLKPGWLSLPPFTFSSSAANFHKSNGSVDLVEGDVGDWVLFYEAKDTDSGEIVGKEFRITVISSDLSFGGATIDDLELTFGEVMDEVELPHAMGGDLPYTYTLELTEVWAAETDYIVGRRIKEGSDYYECGYGHTGPGTGSNRLASFASWAVGTTYDKGSVVKYGSSPVRYWESEQGSNIGKEPGTSDGIDYWIERAYWKEWVPFPVWVVGTNESPVSHVLGDRVEDGTGRYFECLFSHVASADNKPTASHSAWATGTDYVLAAWASDWGMNYQCIKAHTPAESNRPTGTDGAEYWRAYWKEVAFTTLPKGIDFDEIGLKLTGTPSEVASGDMTYTVSDSGSAQDIFLVFELAVVGGFRSDDTLSWLPILPINLQISEGSVSVGQNPIFDLDDYIENPSGVEVEYSVTSTDTLQASLNDENQLVIGVSNIKSSVYTNYIVLRATAVVGGVTWVALRRVYVNLIVDELADLSGLSKAISDVRSDATSKYDALDTKISDLSDVVSEVQSDVTSKHDTLVSDVTK